MSAGTVMNPVQPFEGDNPDEEPAPPPTPNLERLVLDAMTLAATAGGTGPHLAELVNRFWRLVPDEDLGGRTANEMLAAVTTHLRLAEQRLPGQLTLVVEPVDEGTAVLIVTDDMPFLVDSVTAAMSTAGLDVRLLVHPQVVVRREALGRLIETLPDVDPDDAGAGDLVESWMRIEVGALDAESITLLRNDLQRVLTDVREAVEDWPAMRRQALAIADELKAATRPLPVPRKDITDSVGLLKWLADDNFTFLGYREYRLRDVTATEFADSSGSVQVLDAVLGTGLGILRGDPIGGEGTSSATAPEVFARLREHRLLTITKASSRSTVHRAAYLDHISLKIFDDSGNVVGERRFLGLFAASAYRTSVKELPVVARKVAEVADRSGLTERGHSGKQLLAILEDFPRDELFATSTDDLFRTVMSVLRLAGRRQVQVFARPDPYGRFVSCLVYLPRDRFTTANRLRVQEILQRELHGTGVDFTSRVTDQPLARVHVIVRTERGTALRDMGGPQAWAGEAFDTARLSALVAEATKSWDDEFANTLEGHLGEEQARVLSRRYTLPETYKDSHTPNEAMQDLAKLDLLEEPEQLVLHLYRRHRNDDGVHLKVYWSGAVQMALSDVLPVLHSLGVRVDDERPYEISRTDCTIHLYDFGLSLPSGDLDVAALRSNVENAFSAAWHGESEVDDFNRLVLLAGLTWRDVVVLRAYAKYLRQAGTVFSQDYIQATLAAHPAVAAALVALFRARLDPAAPDAGRAKQLNDEILGHLEKVASLDEDRILRSFLTLINATLRTSFFQRGSDGRPKSYISFKLDAHEIPDLPAPRPRFEIFVYSPRFEGVHLRFGAVARGGLRWSDRREDFRTEILGLVKAQTVKNAVIVPTGAKGGFVLKQAPPITDRKAFQAEGVACYRQFIASLLDVTDNIIDGEVVPPSDVVRHDGDDPYLVVAADKGTASFSDIANEISADYGFWLGDAFASGGSAGYDHKKIGITARGAWESVKRYLRETNIDLSTSTLSTVGIGDMSGDVFGNGMLYTDRIRLVAAFDHRHIFIDPDPDPAASFAERQRLFELAGSSWDDYDRSLISAGGGVFARTVKAIPVTQQMRAVLGLSEGEEALPPTALIQAILRAPVDLLFNGGIGTYVKAATEGHIDVGDKTNDAVRVDGCDVRARIVAEGGNLGLTQRGRIEYALSGGSIDGDGVRRANIATDFIDNSAGVDCSDHEVNIKILLRNALPLQERDALLVEMTDEVARLVLRDNYEQATTLGLARAQAASLLPVHRRMITELEQSGHLDRGLEGLPSDEALAARQSAGAGLTSPELAILLAYTKNNATKEIQESTLPDDSWTHSVLLEYFPTALRERFGDRMDGHRLRRELVTTGVVNEAVNRGGLSFLYRAREETDASPADILRAFVVVREVYGLRAIWHDIEVLDGAVPSAGQTALCLDIRRLIDRAVRWLVATRSSIDVNAEIERLRPGVTTLLHALPSLVQGHDRDELLAQVDTLDDCGLPRELAERGARIKYGFGLLDIVEVAGATNRDVIEVAGIYFGLSDRFRVDELLSRISALPRQNRWQTMARMALRYDLYAALAELTATVLASADASADATERIGRWEHANEANVARTTRALAELADASTDLAPLSVLLRQIRTLVRRP